MFTLVGRGLGPLLFDFAQVSVFVYTVVRWVTRTCK